MLQATQNCAQNLHKLKDVETWDAAISQNRIDIELEKAKATQFRSENRPFMADASEKNVEVLTNALATREAERAKSAERRQEIESLLR
jgi:hypothetical protein